MVANGKAWRRAGFWGWAALFTLTGAALGWQLLRLVPRWMEQGVADALRGQGIVAVQFPVESIGFSSTLVGPGTLLMEADALRWDSLLLEYDFSSLLEGRLNRVVMDRPVLSLELAPRSLAAPRPAPAVPPGGGPAAPAPAPAGPPAIPSAAAPAAGPEPLPGLRDVLLQLPLERFDAPRGLIEFLLREQSLLALKADGSLERQPYGAAGELDLENELLAAHLSLRAPARQPELTFQLDLVMQPGALVRLQPALVSALPQAAALPQVTASGQLSLDLLLETGLADGLAGSGELALDTATLRIDNLPADIGLNRFLVAGTLRGQQLSLEGGMELLLPEYAGFSADPFGIRFSSATGAGVRFETEAFGWEAAGMTGRCALRGTMAEAAEGGLPAASMEASFTRTTGDGFEVEPFSLLLNLAGATLRAESSPLGLRRNGTLWLEDLSAEWDQASRSATSGFEWYDAAGKAMGRVVSTVQLSTGGELVAGFAMEREADAPLLGGRISSGGGRAVIHAAGKAPLDWINALLKWHGDPPFSLGGADPKFVLELSGTYPMYGGSVRIDLDGVDVEIDGTRLAGLRGTVALAVNGLPATTGPQQLQADRLESGPVVLTGLSAEWEMPTFRRIEVRRLSGQYEGSTLALEPFVLDPLAPDVATALLVERLEAQQLLELLGEERFTLEGSVSGRIGLRWTPEALVLEGGSFTLADSAGGRFRFASPEFLRERFAAFTGVPEDIRERFLETLLADGIRIDTLEAQLGPAEEPGHVLLRIALSGESRTDQLEIPIKGFVINNIISVEDLAELAGLLGRLNLTAAP